MSETAPGPPLPPLPETAGAEALQGMSEEDLARAGEAVRSVERQTLAAMAPYQQQLTELRARLGEIATERRRRERSAQVAQRASVRQAAKSGALPSLLDVLEGAGAALADEAPLAGTRAYLGSGGEIGFGFATRPGTIAFTDGRAQRTARTWGEARALYRSGWEPGAPGVPGVRVHLSGSRVERVVGGGDVVVEVAPA